MKFKLPKFLHREKRMYVYLAFHLAFLSFIIISATLPSSSTYWMNDLASTFINNIINAFNGVTPVYPTEISVDNYNRNLLSYHFNNKNKFYILEGETMNFHLDVKYPDGTPENLKYKELNYRPSSNVNVTYKISYDKDRCNFAIASSKASENNYVTLLSPNGVGVTINFDIVTPVTPKDEHIYISNKDAKIGSSFFINSLYLECYQEEILADDYSVNSLENVISGGRYYSNTSRDASYCPSLSEGTALRYLNLSDHQYITDDEHIVIDKDSNIVSIEEGVRVGEHKITSSLGGEVAFTIRNEHVAPISVSELKVKSTSAYVNPKQSGSGYIGQTIQLDDLDVLNDHAFIVSSSDKSVATVNFKRHQYQGTFTNKGDLLVRGGKAGECDLTVKLYNHEDIKLEHHVVCDSMEHILNYKLTLLIDDEPYQNQSLEVNKTYKLAIRAYDIATETYRKLDSIGLSKQTTRYKFVSKDGDYEFTFLVDGNITIRTEYKYQGVSRISDSFTVKTIDNQKSSYSNVNSKEVRKIIGHGVMHFFCALFLIMFLLVYFKDSKFRYYSFLLVAATSILIALLTEFIQSLVPGRSPRGKDLLYDYFFALAALVVVGIVVLISCLLKKKFIQKTKR